MINIPKWPVLILAAPRTGSTALGNQICDLDPSIRFLCEPTNPVSEMKAKLRDISTFYKTQSNYVIKIISTDVKKYPPEMIDYWFSDQCFKIKITRNDIVARVASQYIAEVRHRWHFHKAAVFEQDHINVNETRIVEIIKWFNDSNKLIDTFPHDIIVRYEDLIPFDTISCESVKPVNYHEILELVSDILERR